MTYLGAEVLTKIRTLLQVSNERILKVLNVKLKVDKFRMKQLHSYIPLKTFSEGNPSRKVTVIKVMMV